MCKMHKKYIQARSYLIQISRKSQRGNKLLKKCLIHKCNHENIHYYYYYYY